MDLDESSTGMENHVLFLCSRDKFVPMLHVRQAQVQDHDDLTPIFNRQSNMLTNTYGGFFLAELIEAQDESMHCLVAEVECHDILHLIKLEHEKILFIRFTFI